MKAENNKKLKEKKNWILLLLKKLAKILFNRIFYVAVAMLVQLGWIFLMVLRLAAFSRYVDIVIKLVGVVLVLWILNKEINPSYKLAWTMLILILPILGVVLYFVFGRSRIATIMQQHFEQRIEESREYLRDRPETRQKLEELEQLVIDARFECTGPSACLTTTEYADTLTKMLGIIRSIDEANED